METLNIGDVYYFKQKFCSLFLLLSLSAASRRLQVNKAAVNIQFHSRKLIIITIIILIKGKGKAIPLQAWTGPEGSRRMRHPDLKTIDT